jgi:ribosome-binding protein aMBF1 (putative translation factor)
MPARRRSDLADLTPEQRAAVEAIRAKNRTPERRAADARARQLVREEFPPLAAGEDLMEVLAALRLERERLGLSLTDLAERTRLDRATISKLETGKIPNPTVATLRAYASALGKRLAWSLEERHAPAR